MIISSNYKKYRKNLFNSKNKFNKNTKNKNKLINCIF